MREAGGCHPAVQDLSGVAPRAYIGNYRVFNVPLPLGGCCWGTTPEIVAAFETAVTDGMDVINFSGGGPQADPRMDAMMETVKNVVNAGVVPIISAGNDRDFFGLGTAGPPATAPDAIRRRDRAFPMCTSPPWSSSPRRSCSGVSPRADERRAAVVGQITTSGSSMLAPSRA